jgi:Phage integrase, N-terminal SAM-like domain
VTPLRQRLLDELQRRNYSPATTRGYVLAIKQFAEHFGKSPERLGGDEIRQFELHLLKEKKLELPSATTGTPSPFISACGKGQRKSRVLTGNFGASAPRTMLV